MISYDFTIVMAWYNIREKEKNPLKDTETTEFFSVDYYLEVSRNYIQKEFPLIIFVEPQYESKFWEMRPKYLHPITRIIPRDYEDLYRYRDLFPPFAEITYKHPIHNLHREKFTALYNFVINQKVEFVREAIEWNPFNTTRFAWMDLRLHEMDISEINEIFSYFTEDRLLITQQHYTEKEEVSNRYDWLNMTKGRVCAGFFAGYAKLLLKFCNLCRIEFENAIQIGRAPTEEMIYSIVVAENLDMFEPHIGDYEDVLHNILYNRNNTHLTIYYLNWSFYKSYHYYTHKISENLRSGFLKSAIQIHSDNIHNIWYFNYIACYWLNNRDYCKQLLEEYYEILLKNENQTKYVKDIWGFFRHSIQYLDDVEILNKYDTLFTYEII